MYYGQLENRELQIDELVKGTQKDGGARRDISLKHGTQVSMATLTAATTRQCHPDKNSGDLLTHILTMSTNWGGGGGGGASYLHNTSPL